jgi:hypothetical protein
MRDPRKKLGNHRHTISRKPVGVWDWVSAIDSAGRTIWIADAHRDGKRFIVRADELLTAFVELEGRDSVAAGCPQQRISLVVGSNSPRPAADNS